MTSRMPWAAVAAALLIGTAGAAQEAAGAAELVGDAAAGERVFRRCAACHEVGEGAENGVGPILSGLVGRQAGTVPDFEYSDAMREAGAAGLAWTVADLQAYLERPRDVVPGTKMAFPGLRSEEDRNDVIAYVHAQSPPAGEE